MRKSYPPTEFERTALGITVHCSGPQLGGMGAKWGGVPKQRFRPPPNCPACPPKLPFSLRQFQDGGLFVWRSTENLEKNTPIWREDLFFREQQRIRKKIDQPKNVGPLERNFALLKQRSSCGTASALPLRLERMSPRMLMHMHA